jgi:hypothetical protein
MKTTSLALAGAIVISAALTGCDKKEEPKPTLATATAPVVVAPVVTALASVTATATAAPVAAVDDDPVTEEDFADELDDISLTSMETELAKIEKDLK